MWRAIQAVRDGEADAAVSAGNTGALMAMAKFCLKTLPGIERPAIAAIWPTLRGESIVLDVGATIGADARMLVDFAVMGAAMARSIFDLERPTVGLLNVGVEEIKGVEEVREAGSMLREMNHPGFELSRLHRGRRSRQGHRRRGGDRGLCRQHRAEDGRGHGAADRRISAFGDGRTWTARLGYLFAQPAFELLREKMDPRKVNGGVFLGLERPGHQDRMAAPTPKASPAPSTWRARWRATISSA